MQAAFEGKKTKTVQAYVYLGGDAGGEAGLIFNTSPSTSNSAFVYLSPLSTIPKELLL